eukprot:TRINITY_DN18194_c0_g1_i1.p1 TRINITY_DN18194_c0_g1~~TRINITY_DN18194_c0_g1_i1.p1  ORF type:complete len:299 (-),score=66.55 TRINITY_DN18194_c0_g1_i1:20-916(-)
MCIRDRYQRRVRGVLAVRNGSRILMTAPSQPLTGWKHLAAGTIAGGVPCSILHPLDTLKTRMQIQGQWGAASNAPKLTMRQTALAIFTKEGPRGFYNGLTPALLGNCTSWGLYLFLYQAIKERVSTAYGTTHDDLPAMPRFLCGVGAGVITTSFTNPIWLVKTRLQLQQARGPVVGGDQYLYRGTLDAFRKIVKSDGVVGLWRGIGPALLLVSHGSIQFTIYDELKIMLSRRSEQQLSSVEAFACGAMSKVCAQTVTYPTQLIKTRMQDVRNAKSNTCLLYTSPSPRDRTRSRMPSSA